MPDYSLVPISVMDFGAIGDGGNNPVSADWLERHTDPTSQDPRKLWPAPDLRAADANSTYDEVAFRLALFEAAQLPGPQRRVHVPARTFIGTRPIPLLADGVWLSGDPGIATYRNVGTGAVRSDYLECAVQPGVFNPAATNPVLRGRNSFERCPDFLLGPAIDPGQTWVNLADADWMATPEMTAYWFQPGRWVFVLSFSNITQDWPKFYSEAGSLAIPLRHDLARITSAAGGRVTLDRPLRWGHAIQKALIAVLGQTRGNTDPIDREMTPAACKIPATGMILDAYRGSAGSLAFGVGQRWIIPEGGGIENMRFESANFRCLADNGSYGLTVRRCTFKGPDAVTANCLRGDTLFEDCRFEASERLLEIKGLSDGFTFRRCQLADLSTDAALDKATEKLGLGEASYRGRFEQVTIEVQPRSKANAINAYDCDDMTFEDVTVVKRGGSIEGQPSHLIQMGGFTGWQSSTYRLKRVTILNEANAMPKAFGRISGGAIADVEGLTLRGKTSQPYGFEFNNDDPWAQPVGGSVSGLTLPEGRDFLDSLGNVSDLPGMWRARFDNLYGGAVVPTIAPRIVNEAFNSSGKIGILLEAHGLATGAMPYLGNLKISGLLPAQVWTVTVIDADKLQLDGSLWPTIANFPSVLINRDGLLAADRASIERWALPRARALLVQTALERGMPLRLDDDGDVVQPTGPTARDLWISRRMGLPLLRVGDLTNARSAINLQRRPRLRAVSDRFGKVIYPSLASETLAESYIPWRTAPSRGLAWRLRDAAPAASGPARLVLRTLPEHNTLKKDDLVAITGVDAGANGMWRVYDSPTADSFSILGATLFGAYQAESGAVALPLRAVPITGAVSGSNSVIKLTSVAHGFANGQSVFTSRLGGLTDSGGEWVVQAAMADTFELAGSVFSGSYTSGGFAALLSGTGAYRPGVALGDIGVVTQWVDTRLAGGIVALARVSTILSLAGPLADKPRRLFRGDVDVVNERKLIDPANLGPGEWCWSPLLTIGFATGGLTGSNWAVGDEVQQVGGTTRTAILLTKSARNGGFVGDWGYFLQPRGQTLFTATQPITKVGGDSRTPTKVEDPLSVSIMYRAAAGAPAAAADPTLRLVLADAQAPA